MGYQICIGPHNISPCYSDMIVFSSPIHPPSAEQGMVVGRHRITIQYLSIQGRWRTVSLSFGLVPEVLHPRGVSLLIRDGEKKRPKPRIEHGVVVIERTGTNNLKGHSITFCRWSLQAQERKKKKKENSPRPAKTNHTRRGNPPSESENLLRATSRCVL